MTLVVASAGLCCSVGATLAAATYAIRAKVDQFQRSEFRDVAGESVTVARMKVDGDLWGARRLASWMHAAVSDAISASPSPVAIQDIPLFWLAPEPERRGASPGWYRKAYGHAQTLLGGRFHSDSRLFPSGKGGLAEVLDHVARWLENHPDQAALVLGADTLLESADMSQHLRDGRILVGQNADGFIPGEAAAALLVRSSIAPVVGETCLHVLGWSAGTEPGRSDGSVPTRSRGLTEAMRLAIERSALPFEQLSFRFSDQSGESWFAKEAATALARVAPTGAQKLRLQTLADCIGEVGAATGPAMLAYLHGVRPWAGRPPYAPGLAGLLHCAGDGDFRSAAVVAYQAA